MSRDVPLVSAVIPVYNGEAYVFEAVASVLAQTYEPIECVVIDDGSTDTTRDVVARFGDRIRYVGGPHRGVAASRNKGGRVARGSFLAFLDADDTWKRTKIELQMSLFRERPELELVYSSLQHVDARGQYLETIPAPESDQALRNILLQRGPTLSIAQTGLIRSSVFAETGGFDERLSTAADSDLAWRIAAQFEIAAVTKPLATYRSHPAQMHRDLNAYEHDVRILLHKAFTSNLLPPDLQCLERRARTNLALSLAYMYGSSHRRPMRALPRLAEAFRLSPVRCASRMIPLAVQGLRRRVTA